MTTRLGRYLPSFIYLSIHSLMNSYLFPSYSVPRVVLYTRSSKKLGTFHVAQWVKNPLTMQETQEMWVRSLVWEDPPEEGMATHSSILAWRIPQTEEPGGLQSMGSWRVGHDSSDWACTRTSKTHMSRWRPGFWVWGPVRAGHTTHSNTDCVKPDHHMDVDLLSQKQRAWSRDHGKQDPAAISKLQIVPRSSISWDSLLFKQDATCTGSFNPYNLP